MTTSCSAKTRSLPNLLTKFFSGTQVRYECLLGRTCLCEGAANRRLRVDLGWCKIRADRVKTPNRNGNKQLRCSAGERSESIIRPAAIPRHNFASHRDALEFSHGLREFRTRWLSEASGEGKQQIQTCLNGRVDHA